MVTVGFKFLAPYEQRARFQLAPAKMDDTNVIFSKEIVEVITR